MKIVIAIPAYNEEVMLSTSVERLVVAVRQLPHQWRIIIADNRSQDKTASIAKQLAATYTEVRYLLVPERGKGLAIRTAWQSADADAYSFMDADLATDLSALPALVNGIIAGSDLVIGSRFHRQSVVVRSASRKLISRGYRLVLWLLFRLRLKDAPCGFKAINASALATLLPLVHNDKFFFDSELVILAEKLGYGVTEIPVHWHDPREGEDRSKVNPLTVSIAYLREALALRGRLRKLRQAKKV